MGVKRLSASPVFRNNGEDDGSCRSQAHQSDSSWPLRVIYCPSLAAQLSLSAVNGVRNRLVCLLLGVSVGFVGAEQKRLQLFLFLTAHPA